MEIMICVLASRSSSINGLGGSGSRLAGKGKRSAAENAALASLVSERLRGVDAGGAPRGEIAGQHAHRAQDQRGGGGDGGRERRPAQELEGLALEGQGGDDLHQG